MVGMVKLEVYWSLLVLIAIKNVLYRVAIRPVLKHHVCLLANAGAAHLSSF